MMYAYLSTLCKLTKADKRIDGYDKYKKDLMNYIKQNRKEILKDRKISKKDRISLHCTKFGFNFFKVSWKVYERIKKRKSK